MKRLMFTMMAVGLLMACVGGSTDTMRRLQQAEDVVEEHPDSAAMLLSQVVTTGMTEEETALYGLLWTMAEFKKHNKDVNDSLVSRCIDYFDQLRPKRWQEWERRYSGLSTAQYIFLIMQDDLHYDDEAIATALNVKRTSVRSMRSRIKGRER